MNGTNEATVFAVQSAFLELIELTLSVAPDDDPDKQEALRQEVQKAVLMFIAAIILFESRLQSCAEILHISAGGLSRHAGR